MTVLTYFCSLTATVASWNVLNSAAKWDPTLQELFLAAQMLPKLWDFFFGSLRASAFAPCRIWGLSLDEQINNVEQKKQLATCSMSEECREFPGLAHQGLGLNAWLSGDVINPLQLRLLGFFKIGFLFLLMLISHADAHQSSFFFFFKLRFPSRWTTFSVLGRCSFYPSVCQKLRLCVQNFGVRSWSDPTWNQQFLNKSPREGCVWRWHTLWCAVNKLIKVTKLRQLFLLVFFCNKSLIVNYL